MTSSDCVAILHVTDFHLMNPGGVTEHLRMAGFKGYIRGLLRAIRLEYKDKISAIVVTGDLTTKGDVSKFGHAGEVLKWLAKESGVEDQDVFLTCGNHDVERNLDASEPLAARARFNELATKFGNGRENWTGDGGQLARVIQTTEKLFVLLLDATWGAAGENVPSKIDVTQRDEIMSLVENVPVERALIIASHYPVYPGMASRGAIDDDDPNYAAHHIWAGAFPLIDRMGDLGRTAPTLWLAGDVHNDYEVQLNNQYFIGTGRFGTSVDTKSDIRRQAHVIGFSPEPMIIRAEWRPDMHVATVDSGAWETVRRSFVVVNTSIMATASPVADGPEPVSATRTPTRLPPIANVSNVAEVELLDEELQARLIGTISDNRLYHLGRFVTSSDEVTLGWVTVGPLLNANGNLDVTIDTMAKWAKGIKAFYGGEILLVGLDGWGAVLASMMSVVTGFRCVPVAGRGKGAFHAAFERVDTAATEFARAGNIVCVTDAVGSGRTLSFVRDELRRLMPAIRPRWFALSLLCDKTRDRSTLAFLTKHATACRDLRFPVVSPEFLPDAAIVPPTLSV